MENTKQTDQVKEVAEKNQENEIRKEKRTVAFKTLKEFFEKNPNEKCMDALKTLRPSMFGLGGGRTSGTPIFKTIVDKIIAAGDAGVKEMTLFQDFHIGRKETQRMIKRYLDKVEPKDRVWIEFTPSNGIYKVIGKGEKAPANYTGPKPVERVTELK